MDVELVVMDISCVEEISKCVGFLSNCLRNFVILRSILVVVWQIDELSISLVSGRLFLSLSQRFCSCVGLAFVNGELVVIEGNRCVEGDFEM